MVKKDNNMRVSEKNAGSSLDIMHNVDLAMKDSTDCLGTSREHRRTFLIEIGAIQLPISGTARLFFRILDGVHLSPIFISPGSRHDEIIVTTFIDGSAYAMSTTSHLLFEDSMSTMIDGREAFIDMRADRLHFRGEGRTTPPADLLHMFDSEAINTHAHTLMTELSLDAMREAKIDNDQDTEFREAMSELAQRQARQG